MSGTAQIATVMGLIYTGYAAANVPGIANDLTNLGHAPLTGGQIFIGPENLSQNDDQPRMVFVPKGGPLIGRAMFNTVDPGGGAPVAAVVTNPAVQGHELHGQMHIWGLDYDDCLDLMDEFVRSAIGILSSGNAIFGEPMFTETTLIAVRGREIVLPFGWNRAITVQPIPIPIPTAPAGTVGVGTEYLGQSVTPGCTS